MISLIELYCRESLISNFISRSNVGIFECEDKCLIPELKLFPLGMTTTESILDPFKAQKFLLERSELC